MARIVRFTQTGGPEVLRIDEEEVRAPAPGEVQIDVHTIGLNRAEAAFRQGKYLEDPKMPASLGYEAAGTVVAVGEGVKGFTPGDAVSTIPAFSQNDYFTYGERVNMPVHAVAKHPANLSWEQAVAIWMPYLTAYGALVDIGKLGKGDVVLINAASSSVGLAAIDLARSLGAIPIALTRTSAKAARLEEAGAAHVVATQEQDVAAVIHDLTKGAGAKLAFDPVGGPGVEPLCNALQQGGILVLYGLLSRDPAPLPIMPVLAKQLTVRGYVLFEFTTTAERLAPARDFVAAKLAAGELTPVIDKVFPFEQIADAHRYLQENGQIGKIVVKVK